MVFLKLPQIRRIAVANIIKFYFLDTPAAGSVPSSTMTHLRFTHARIPNWVLLGILRVPIALTHFSYSMVLNSGFHPFGFMATLAPLRLSVQFLHLNFGEMELWDDRLEMLYDAGSLGEWPVLRTLSCSLILLGRHFLCPSTIAANSTIFIFVPLRKSSRYSMILWFVSGYIYTTRKRGQKT